MCNLIRFIFIIEASFFIYYLVTFSSYIYLLLVILLLSIIADGLSLLIENNGEEKQWYNLIKIPTIVQLNTSNRLCRFSKSNFFYTIIFIVFIWNVVITKYETKNFNCQIYENNHDYWIFVSKTLIFFRTKSIIV